MSAITVYANDMLTAQGATLEPEHRAELVAKADRFRQITGTTEPTLMMVPVKTTGGAHIGYLNYML